MRRGIPAWLLRPYDGELIDDPFSMTTFIKFALAWLAALALNTPVNAQVPINPNLAEAIKALPVPGISSVATQLIAGLTPIRGGYTAKTIVSGTPVMLYLYGSSSVSQTMFLVVGGNIALPNVFNNSTWRRIAGSSVNDAIFSLATIDFSLKTEDMNDDLKQVVKRSYYGNSKLEFKSGFQLQGNISLNGLMKTVLESGMGMPVQSFLMRAGMAIPTPTDTNGQVALGLTMLNGIKNIGATFQDLPEFYLELQTAPGSAFTGLMGMSAMQVTDAMFSVKNSGVVGFKGNLVIPGGKKFITQFETPLNPGGVMDFADFKFALAAQSLTLEDVARLSLAMATPKLPGGGFLKEVNLYQQLLQNSTKPLSMIQVRNPHTVGEYRYADETRPFPSVNAFNLMIVGPGASMEDGTGKTVQGPMLKIAGIGKFLGQEVADVSFYAGPLGLRGKANVWASLNVGPLGTQNIKLESTTTFTRQEQNWYAQGEVSGRWLYLAVFNNEMHVGAEGICAQPFEVKQKLDLVPTFTLDYVMRRVSAKNVDPSLINACTGNSLKAGLRWITSNGQSLEGYKPQQAADKLKDMARDVAHQATHQAAQSFKSAGNFVKGAFGQKKKKRNPPKTPPMFAGSVFDWDYYYDTNPELVKADVDLIEHWRSTGWGEGRRGSLEFSPSWYMWTYPDAYDAAYKRGRDGLVQNWLDVGIPQGRQGSPDFSIKAYLARSPDLQKLYGATGYDKAFDHWLEWGKAEGRSGKP